MMLPLCLLVDVLTFLPLVPSLLMLLLVMLPIIMLLPLLVVVVGVVMVLSLSLAVDVLTFLPVIPAPVMLLVMMMVLLFLLLMLLLLHRLLLEVEVAVMVLVLSLPSFSPVCPPPPSATGPAFCCPMHCAGPGDSPVALQTSTRARMSRNSPTPTLLRVRRLKTGTARPAPRHSSGCRRNPSCRTRIAGACSAGGRPGTPIGATPPPASDGGVGGGAAGRRRRKNTRQIREK